MDGSKKRKVVAGAAAALAVAGGGAAIGATQLRSDPESNAVVSDAAKQLGVTPEALSNALKKALENRVDAAVSAGRLTKAEGDAIKARIESGDVPFFGLPRLLGLPGGPDAHFGRHLFFVGGPDGARAYLGMTDSQLDNALHQGKTLAQIAKDKGKSVDGLIDAIVAARTKRLDQAVKEGRLTKADEQLLLKDLKQRVTDFVNGTFPPRPEAFGDGHFWRPGSEHFVRPVQSDFPPAA
jgi:hypothetical protein